MLFKETHLQGIKSGKISLAFRKWKKVAVKTGSLLLTSIGLVKIGKIQTIEENNITDQDALSAGFENSKKLIQTFPDNSTGIIYKIEISFYAPDPRIKLQDQNELSEEHFEEIKRKLQRLDDHSKHGQWTANVLMAIKHHPNLHAVGIAKITGYEKEWLKLNIRKLKNLGLTISHQVGYEISPFGELVLKKLKAEF
ncbi:MAG TPA: hypothetical protein PKC30_09620 [Saprospiraceae bacterium]|nr:hypothetical protein [Saprospiraceae bacterium]